MIKSLRLKNFKNFADVSLPLGPFTVIVGANASGKSNVRDAFRVLHGIARGYTLAEVIGGRYGVGGQYEWEPIRGAANEIIRFGESAFELGVECALASNWWPGGELAAYRVAVGAENDIAAGFRVEREQLVLRWETVFTTHPENPDPVRKQDDEAHLLLRMRKSESQRKYGHRVQVRPDQPALTQLAAIKRVARRDKDVAVRIIDILERARFLDPTPELMRKPSFPGQLRLGDRGENLPTVLRKVWEDSPSRDAIVGWIRALTPMDVDGFDFPVDPTTGQVQLAIREQSGRTVSAYSVSDGTLRFLAILAALFSDEPAQLYVFEEIDNGIHPSRLSLLVDLMEQQTASKGIQVVTTTHSPELLSIVNDDTFENMSVACRPEGSEDAVIRRVSELPNVQELRRSQSLGRLHVGGWMENAVEFVGA